MFKSQISDYKRDVINLIGLDYESIPSGDLRDVLKKCYTFLPEILDKKNSLTRDQCDKMIKDGLGINSVENELIEKKNDSKEKKETCDAFKKNYFERRQGKIAYNHRLFLGTTIAKKLSYPEGNVVIKDEIIGSIKKYFPFSILDDDKLRMVVNSMVKFTLEAGDFLIKKDSIQDKFYYVQSGLLGTVMYQDKCYVTQYFKKKECIGSENLFLCNVSQRTIKCLQPATLFVLDAKSFQKINNQNYESIYRFLENSLKSIPSFKKKYRKTLVNRMRLISMSKDEDVLIQTPISAFYIVYKGKVLVKEINRRGDIFTRVCNPGDNFGQDRLFTKRFATLSSATAMEDSVIYYLENDAFCRIFDVKKLYKKAEIPEKRDYLFYRTL